jgi:nitrite reductase (NADH) large subunit
VSTSSQAGKHLGGPDCEDIVFRDAGRGVYKRIVLEAGKVAGAVLFGDAADGGWYFDLMKSGEDVAAFRETLVFGQAATEGLRGLDPSAAVAAMADTAEVCGCNGVCKGQITAAIAGQGLTTLESVRAVTKASASCGTCTPLVEKLLKLSARATPSRPDGPEAGLRLHPPRPRRVRQRIVAEELKSIPAACRPWSGHTRRMLVLPPGAELLPALRVARRVSRRQAEPFINERRPRQHPEGRHLFGRARACGAG